MKNAYVPIVFSTPLQNLFLQHHHQWVIRAGVRVRAALSAAVYQHMLTLDPAARASFGNGMLTNLISTDSNTVGMTFWFMHYSWAAPLQIAICLAMLYQQLGVSTFVALGVLVALIPVQGAIAGIIGSLTKATMKHTDSRVKLISEVVSAIRVVKLFAFEADFLGRVRESRSSELKAKRSVSYANAVNTTLMNAGPLVAALLAFLTYGLTSSQPLSAGKAFASLTLFTILRLPLMVLPMLLSTFTAGKVSFKRIAKFLHAPKHVDYRAFSPSPSVSGDSNAPQPAGTSAAEFHGATLSWVTADDPGAATADSSKPVDAAKPSGSAAATDVEKPPVAPATPFQLRRLNLALPTGKLTTIVGSVGSGKSSLLAALLGEMRLSEGSVTVFASGSSNGSSGEGKHESTSGSSDSVAVSVAGPASGPQSIAYCSQLPWVLNATVKENIIFSSEFNSARYEAVLDACALRPDLAILPAGDATQVGDAGVTLSGGQKARIALARAIYSHCPILLLDDVLSAVDAHVGRHIFTAALRGHLVAGEGRTVVLASHQLQYLPSSDYVVALRAGAVAQAGTFDDVINQVEGMTSDGGSNVVRELMVERQRVDDSLADAVGSAQNDAAASEKKSGDVIAGGADTPAPSGAADDVKTPPASDESTPVAEKSDESTSKSPSIATAAVAASKGAHSAEDRQTGSVPLSVYRDYLSAFGGCMRITMWLALLLSSAAIVGTDVWLSVWSDARGGYSTGMYIWVYAIITVASALLMFVYSACWASGGTTASYSLHDRMLSRVIRAPISFYDTTPAGRITNRFSGDIDIIDRALPTSFQGFLSLAARIVGTIVLEAVILPWSLIGFAVTAVVYAYVQMYYAASSRELKRLDNITKSPVLAHLSETLTGLPTIRAYGAGGRFVTGFQSKLDRNSLANLTLNLVNRWLGLRLDWIGGVIVACVCLVAVLTAGTLNPGLVGLAISNAIAITGLLNWAVRNQTEVQQYLASVERILHYSRLPVEAAPIVPGNRPKAEWPAEGSIDVSGLCVRYRPDLPQVLKGISFSVKAGTKIGVCGRTGCGKSSLMLALFRMLEAEEGRITIDGIDISTIGLDDLRSKLAIIPQDATLFNGSSVRRNVDPTGKSSDADISAALERVQMAEAVQALGGLDATVQESSLSAGQRQLLCFARALVRKPKVLVLDEASASTDVKTDALLQRMLRSDDFRDTTLLAIAHRVHTVADADMVLVLDAGRVAEYAPPSVLLADPDSMFAKLVSQSRTSGE